jgi:hypothetical protein
VPTLRARFEIRSALLSWLPSLLTHSPDSTGLRMREGAQLYLRNAVVNLGAVVLPRARRAGDPAPTPAHDPAVLHKPPPDDRLLNTLSAHYARRLVDVANRHAITVYWVLPPLSPPARAHRRSTGEEAYLVRLASLMQARSRNVVVIDGREAAYDPNVFVDLSHLDRKGAEAFSAALAGIIAGSLAEGAPPVRWMALAPYRESPGNPRRMEDLHQSLGLLKVRGVIR